MASTIKLKTSTSSGNVPASLSKGEVAINVADGVWYYGGASAVQQNFKFGSVTVTGDTSLDGKLVVTGNTVMNGTLSASSVNVGNGNGTVSAATITASGTIQAEHLRSTDDVQIDDDLTVSGKGTFGDLSVETNGSNAVIALTRDSAAELKLKAQASSNRITYEGGPLYIDRDESGTNTLTLGSSGNIQVANNLVITGNTVMNGTLSATTSLKVGNGNGTISAATINGVNITGNIGSDASPVTAYINNGEIDGVTLGSESAVSIAGANYLDIANSQADNVALSVIGHASQTASIIEVKDGGEEGTLWFGVAANGRSTINSAVINGGTINSASIGATTRNTGAFTTLISQLGLTSQSTLVVTGNTTLNGTLSATTSCKVGNGDGLISGATITAGETFTLADGKSICFGNKSGGDGKIKHSGSNLQIQETTGNIQITNYTNDGDITLSTDDGSGSETTYITLDGGVVNTRIHTPLVVTGNTVLNGTLSASSINVGNGDGSVSAATYTAAGSISLPDNGTIIMGDGDDTEIKQTGSETIIKDASTGNIKLRAGTVTVQNGAANKTMAVFNGANKVELFYNNNSKFETTNTGVDVTGDVLASGALVVTGNTVLNGTLSATTSLKVGNGDGLISAATFTGTKHLLRTGGVYINDDPFVQNSLYMGNSSGNQPSNWNDPQAAGGVLSDTGTVNISEDDMKWANILPFDISKIEIQCSLRTGGASTGDDFFIGLYTASRKDCDGASTMDITKIADSQDTFCQGKYVTNDFDYIGNLDKGTLIFVGIGTESSSAAKNGAGILNITITQR